VVNSRRKPSARFTLTQLTKAYTYRSGLSTYSFGHLFFRDLMMSDTDGDWTAASSQQSHDSVSGSDYGREHYPHWCASCNRHQENLTGDGRIIAVLEFMKRAGFHTWAYAGYVDGKNTRAVLFLTQHPYRRGHQVKERSHLAD
jgi:hypothetical protein